MIEEEKFFAWLDGELESEEAAAVEAEVERDPELSRMAREHRAMAAELRSAFEPIVSAPVPAMISVARAPAETVLDMAAHREKGASRWFGWAPQWAAMAATMALGVAIGTMVGGGSSSPVEVRGGSLYAASAVSQALDNKLASAAAADVRIALTFRDQGGAICRTFMSEASSGLACREDGRWKVQGIFAAPEGQRTDYRMAAASDPQLLALVDERIAGEPFDAEQERSALARGWR